MSGTKQKKIGFSFKPRDKMLQPRQQPHQQQQTDHRPIEETQSASSDSMPEIAMSYQPHRPRKTFKLPETVYGKQKRSFQRNWFEKYPWLDHDVEEDSVNYVFCKR